MIKIGITACIMPPDSTRATFSKKDLFYVESDMVHYLNTDKSIPLMIPNFKQEKDLHRFIDQLDAVVIHGGVDVCPLSYGEDYLDKALWPGDKVRDDYELAVIDYAFKQGKPILGICRGFQLLNVYFGGTLYQDIATQLETPITHANRPIYDQNYHAIEFLDDSLLANIIYANRSQKGFVNSIHHQSIKKLGENLKVEAISPEDKIIEAFKYDNDDNFIYGVQWHPEFNHTLGDKLIGANSLLKYFISQILKK
ncbi:gamma-glutamyl-gamma-aminobutyrate hydrolase family protein [Francisella sp. Scap27]|uniref:gamma-glutamyl-gamma-aminobutyrate hydrolase family protein n=1 Tax=Francisella sp. Scap27 TaxID=2589986 RepID=UPI0015BE52B6|nr:gamma-glutamyl-gamma-aminobutyrate hydrolase family protein [Francisella sp. Scap27]QLE79772.1 gamma-glutamyl-gamma-aminobutyrate hydrolase family protein [Francisella sp. Scap27]